MPTLTGAQAIVRLLRAEQVTHVFGLVGGKLAPLLHAMAKEPGLRFVGVRHEAAGAMAAAAWQAGTGQMAVAIGEMGPGGLNLASGMGVAFANNLPMLAITTNQHRAAAYPHRGMFMDLDTRAVFAPVVKWNAVVHDARRMPELVRRAFREAWSGRPGPVHLDIPQDVLATTCDYADDEFALPPARYRASHAPRPDARGVAAAVQMLSGARRPLVVAGGGAVASGAVQQVRDLAQWLRAPIVATQMGLGAARTDSPAFIGHGGLIAGDAVRQAFQEADTVVSVGCRYSSWMWDEQGAFARAHHRHLAINIDPSSLGLAAHHELALHADAALALDDILRLLQEQGRHAATEADWLHGLRNTRLAYEARLHAMADETSTPQEAMHPAALARAIGRALPANALAVFDGGHTTFWSNDLTPASEPRTRLHEPGMSHLGFGLPFAMALQLAHPNRPVFNLTGDGSFGFTLQELDSARRHGLPVVTVIHNNAAWGIIRSGQRKQLDFELGTGLEDTDYAAIARGFGCHGERVEQVQDIPGAIERALASGRPAVLDCQTRFVPHPAMPLFASMNRHGFAVGAAAMPSSQ